MIQRIPILLLEHCIGFDEQGPLDRIQRSFPIVSEPFRILSEGLDISERRSTGTNRVVETKRGHSPDQRDLQYRRARIPEQPCGNGRAAGSPEARRRKRLMPIPGSATTTCVLVPSIFGLRSPCLQGRVPKRWFPSFRPPRRGRPCLARTGFAGH